LERACTHLYGEAAGAEMAQAYAVGGESGLHPVSRIWWVVTREVRRLLGDLASAAWTWQSVAAEWQQRQTHTEQMLEHVQRARALRPGDPDLEWLAVCLEVGRRFAAVIRLSAQRRQADRAPLRAEVLAALDDLQAHLDGLATHQPTDFLGGDPGCWQETLTHLREVAKLDLPTKA
jgi:hypothetical protein